MARSIAWFAVSMRWVFSTPFGVPVEPEVNSTFATVSGVIASNAAARLAPGTAAASGSRSVTAWARVASSAGPKASASSANTTPGRTSSAIARRRPWSLDSNEYAALTGTTGTPAV